MVVVNKRTNIFNLINNKDSSVDDFKKLYQIAPEKFKLLNEFGDTILKTARYNRHDLLEYFRTLDIFKNDPDKILEEIERLVYSTENETSPNKLKEIIKDIDLSKFDISYIKDILRHIYAQRDKGDKWTHDMLFALVDNPKGGIDINFKYAHLTPIFHIFDLITSERAEYILDKYKPDIIMAMERSETLLHYLIRINDKENRYNIIKLVLEYGLRIGLNIYQKVDNRGYLSYIYRYGQPDFKDKLYKLFITHGANIDENISDNYDYTLLILSIINKNIELVDFLLENGADVNYIAGHDKATAIAAAILEKNTNIIKKLIEKGVDVNIISGPQKYSLLRIAISPNYKLPLDIIKLLLDSGANKDYKSPVENLTALEYAIKEYNTDKEYYKHVIELLGGKIPGEEVKWKGFSRSDIEKFDIFFEKPFDWSCCPVCLEYVERSDGCMYMSHDCKTRKHFYHKKLYDKFVYDYHGNSRIEWCTICGRITQLHKHYKLSSAQTPLKELAPLKPEIQEQLERGDNIAFFDNANCIGFGGGGTEEKAARFRRMREYALELQDDVDKKLEDGAMEELIEEAWNAPLVRNKKIKKILEDKKWNINVKEFPENKRNTRNNNNNNNTNAANIPFNGVKPTIIEDDCIIFRKDQDTNTQETNPKYHFHHETIGGIDHEGIYICQKDLATAIEIKNAEFGLDTFTKCWWHYTCKANLHPEELKDIIPDVLYEEYRKKFNKKMKQKGGTRKLKKQMMRGGNPTSMLHELEDGTCTPHNWTRDGKVRKL